jgi:dihydrofolate reductase
MSITIVAAVDQNNGIGLNGKLPWHVPADLAHFKRTALGKWLVAGRKTVPTLPEWARDGKLFTLTNDKAVRARCTVEGIRELSKIHDIYVIGGAQTYAAFLPHANRIILTLIHDSYPADRYFPLDVRGHVATLDWRWTEREFRARCKTSGVRYSIYELTRQEQP